jgi:putative membrane protein
VTTDLERGLQPERTALAHVRTVLSLVVVAMLIVRQADDGTERVVAALLAAAAVVVATIASLARQRELRAMRVGHPSSPLELGALTVAIAVLQVLALVVVL